MTYRCTADVLGRPGWPMHIASRTFVNPTKHPGYLEWIAAGNTPEPYIPTAEEIVQEAQESRNAVDRQEIKGDAKFQNLISKTPAQARNWVDNSFPTLTTPERKDLATLVIAIGILGRQL